MRLRKGNFTCDVEPMTDSTPNETQYRVSVTRSNTGDAFFEGVADTLQEAEDLGESELAKANGIEGRRAA